MKTCVLQRLIRVPLQRLPCDRSLTTRCENLYTDCGDELRWLLVTDEVTRKHGAPR